MRKGCGRACDAVRRVVYAALTSDRDKRGMTRFDKSFAALSHRMSDMSAPRRAGGQPPSIASLIDRVNAAKQRYQLR
jgi:hypothetical protein